VKVLVIDVGGSHVKMLATGQPQRRRFDSHAALTPDELVREVLKRCGDWDFDVVSLGYPGAAGPDGPTAEPGNLGRGWVGFDFARAFGRPVRVVNDAAMQALGGYAGGRMLFLGLGTGVGSAFVAERVVVPLELGCLRYDGEDLFHLLGKHGLERRGVRAWSRTAGEVITMLRQSFAADYVLLGGGHEKFVDPLPEGTRRGGNGDAFTGGFRLWEEWVEPHDARPPNTWRVVG